MESLARFKFELLELLNDALPPSILNEGDLERRFLLPKLWQLLGKYPNVHVYAHPWNHSLSCQPTCEQGRGLLRDKDGVFGCKDCWKKSKTDYAAKMYGRHAFDVVARDKDESLAIELKFLRNPKKGNAKANGEFQRFLGQCLLATLAHRHVIGVCVAENRALDWTGPTGVNTFIVAPVVQNKTSITKSVLSTMPGDKEIKLIIKMVP
jgi:hypothetical protein